MNCAGSVLCPIIIGRDDLIDLAERRLGEAAAGHGQFLLLAGEAGVGKSRLLDAIRRKSRAAGFIDANGSVSPQDHEVPSSLIGELARTLKRNPAFGTLGDELLALGGVRDADALGSRRLYVLDIVDRIAAAIDGPVMLNFEDIQWADETSLEILGELARRLRDRPVLLVAAYRTEDLPPGAFFREWRARLIGQRLAEEARLGPLTYDQTALMTTLILDTGLPAPREVVQAVHQRTDGIPLHIEELLGALSDDARSDGRAIRDAVVPETIEDAIRARLAKLSPEAREVAQAGAVIGRCFIPEVLAGIMDRPLEDLDGPIDELIQRSYLYDAGDPGFIDFRHQLLRDVLYRSVRPAELRRLHARAGEFGAKLEGQSEIHSSVHFERAGMRVEAHRTALAGARAASRVSARQEAYDLYRRAIDNMPDDLPMAEQAELYNEFADAAGAIERNEDSLAAAKRARESFLAAGMPLRAATMLLEIGGSSARDGGSVFVGLEHVAQAFAEVEAQPESPERAAALAVLYTVRAFYELDALQLDAATADAAEALARAEAAGDRESALEARLTAARIEIIRGNHGPGLAAGLEAARAARDAGFESVGVTGYRNLAIAAARVMDYGAADAAIGEGLRYADAIEQSHCRQMMAATSALMAWNAGRWDEADVIARQELAERGCRRGILGALDVTSLVLLGRGDVDGARQRLDESLAAGRRVGEIQYILPPLWGELELDLVVGDPAAARRASHRSPRSRHELGRASASHPVRRAERQGLAGPASTRRGGALAGPGPRAPGRLGRSRRRRAAPREGPDPPRQRLPRRGARAFETAIRGWTDRHRVWEATWAQLDLAQTLMRMNRYGDAASQLVAVRDTATALRSAPLLARADELARIARGRGTIDEAWHPLTAREFEVARLIADGMTNAEIADALSIAPKTASAHVEHILAKLGVMRRAEIAAWTATVLAAVGCRELPTGVPARSSRARASLTPRPGASGSRVSAGAESLASRHEGGLDPDRRGTSNDIGGGKSALDRGGPANDRPDPRSVASVVATSSSLERSAVATSSSVRSASPRPRRSAVATSTPTM